MELILARCSQEVGGTFGEEENLGSGGVFKVNFVAAREVDVMTIARPATN